MPEYISKNGQWVEVVVKEEKGATEITETPVNKETSVPVVPPVEPETVTYNEVPKVIEPEVTVPKKRGRKKKER